MERNEAESHERLERLAAVDESAEEIARAQSGKSISAQVNCAARSPGGTVSVRLHHAILCDGGKPFRFARW
jgi:hypothetical protein